MAELEELEKGLKTLSRKIPALIESNPPSILTEVEMIPLYVDSERKLVDLMVELNIGLQEIFEDYAVQLGDTKFISWKAKLAVIKNQLSSFRQEVAVKIKDLKQSSNPTQQSPQVSPSMSNNSTVNTSLEQDRLNFDRDKQRKQEERLQTEAETRMNAVIEDTKKFGSKFPSMAEDWTLEENIKIETAMKEISNWEKMMSRLKKEAREVEIIVKGNSLADTQGMVQTMQVLMTKTEKCMDNSIKQVQYLDSSRNLNTLGTKRVELVKLPQFSGKSGEDFVTFKKKMEKAFSSNRIPTDDQVEKLCENLRDGAKLVVPDGTDDVERAWDILQAAYGGEDKVMQNRKDKLSSLGSLPEAGVLNKGGQSKRITWCLELERLLSEIVELGNRNDGLAKEAFSKSTINIVIGMFPPDIRKDMIKVRSEGSDKLLEIIEIIEAERAIFQEDEQFIAKKPQGRHHQRDGGGGGGAGGGSYTARSSTTPPLSNPRGYQTYKGPSKLPSCRICKTLETRGDTTNLYENHLGNYATGCPRYAALTTEERFEVTKESKICLRCLDPKSTYVYRDGHKGCQVSKTKKNRFSCTNTNCSWHSWICYSHKDENKELMNKFVAELSKKGLVFTFFNSSANSCADESQALKSKPQANPKIPCLRDTSNDLTREQAVEKLLKLTPNGVDLDTEPKGAPMFMFGCAEGKTRAIPMLYDSGCSDLLLEDGVPGNELEGVKVANGPFVIGAVGGVKVMARDAWMVKCKMMGGGSQVLEGLTVDKVTSCFPTVNLDVAVKAVKSSQPGNKLLQNIKIPSQVGGKVEILIGIKYNALFPTLIHMLPNGLALYHLKVKSFKNLHTAVIAGPHSSFDRLLDKVGNTAYLLQKFQEGLQNWRSLSPPKIKQMMCPPMTREDEYMAMHLNIMEHGNVVDLPEEEDLLRELCPVAKPSAELFPVAKPSAELDNDDRAPVCLSHRSLKAQNLPDEVVEIQTQETCEIQTQECGELCKFIQCDECGRELRLSETELMKVHASVIDEDAGKLSTTKMKKIVEAQDQGLQIEYRCPKCRQCSECLKPIETERISLREEAEIVAITESVRLDLDNKRIICSLPLRGKEEEFLSTNKFQAEKILKQQCTKYFNDGETKPLILKAFKKLFDNKHAKLLRDLPVETVEKILSKKVNHFIPWRVVFKDSISTPARPVLDASSNTPLNPDGTGGRSLNDACMKGRIPDMNLLRMVLRFMVGRFGLAGDLSQFYNVFKLVEDQWNLQLFVWKDDINPDNETLVK